MSLFDEPERSPPPGLEYRSDFLGPTEEAALADWIDSQPWQTELARRVQHYGWRYDYRARRVLAGDRLGALPPQLHVLAVRLEDHGLFDQVPDQAIVNEYLPGQGIAPHIDCEPCFGDQIAMISLLDPYPMEFAHPSGEQWTIGLERRSVCVISGPSRWEWTHGIAKRLSDPELGGGRRKRGRRLSITFRTVVR